MKLGLRLSIDRAIRGISVGGQPSWRPTSLFSTGEQGVWYDPSDLSTLYQDSAGTTPVTAMEQPVGLMLDKRLGLMRGVEKIADPTLTDATGWTLGGTSSIVGGKLLMPAGAYESYHGTQESITLGKYYEVTFTISANTSNFGVRVMVRNVGTGGIFPLDAGNYYTSPGTYRISGYAGSDGAFAFNRVSGHTGTTEIDNISVRELPGNHATQPTAAARPVLSSRVNKAIKTADLTDGAWAKVRDGTGILPVVTAGLTDPEGGSTAFRVQCDRGAGGTAADVSLVRQTIPGLGNGTRSVWIKSNTGSPQTFALVATNAGQIVTATAEWQRVAASQTTGDQFDISSYGLVPTTQSLDILVWRPQAETGPTATRYQRVTTATDYDSVGFPHYLKFDGVDDFMVTGNIDFTGTDKMTVWAGVRQLVASTGAVVELGATGGNAAGGFGFLYGGTGANHTLATHGGTAAVNRACAIPTTPTPYVVACAFDHALSGVANEIAPRQNGVVPATTDTGADSGIGNYGNAAIYIGSRGGSSLRLNGHLNQLIIRGALTDAGRITSGETYTNSKTGAY